MTSKQIEKVVIKNMAERQFPIYLAHYQNRGFSEADVFGISKAGHMYEFEIKISRSDFFADFKHKTTKHRELRERDAKYTHKVWKRGKCTDETYDLIGIANRFYYVCPILLIRLDEVPEYAGLIYIDTQSKYIEIKPAPLLHHYKANEAIYKNVATILSERNEWGCAYRVYKNKPLIPDIDTTTYLEQV
jgi:hypothetical protein